MRPEAELKILIENHPEISWLNHRFDSDSPAEAAVEVNRTKLMIDISYSIIGLDKASAESFRPYSLEAIVDYLSHSHQYYLNRAIPGIASNLERLIHNSAEHSHVLRAVAGLFRKFCDNLEAHILWEELGLLRYAKILSNCARSGRSAHSLEEFRLSTFIDQHPDHRNELSQIVALLGKLDKIYGGDMAFRMVKKQIFDLEADLYLHGLIEDEVLLEKVSELKDKLDI